MSSYNLLFKSQQSRCGYNLSTNWGVHNAFTLPNRPERALSLTVHPIDAFSIYGISASRPPQFFTGVCAPGLATLPRSPAANWLDSPRTRGQCAAFGSVHRLSGRCPDTTPLCLSVCPSVDPGRHSSMPQSTVCPSLRQWLFSFNLRHLVTTCFDARPAAVHGQYRPRQTAT